MDMWYNYLHEKGDDIMPSEIRESIERLKEVKSKLLEYPNKEEAVDMLINETGLAKDECETAYEFLMNTEFPEK